ncbi:MAG TPA: signal peptidase II [Gemmataceae bacterium]|nr:signal peptidase II [Gemmataceae bacterium]
MTERSYRGLFWTLALLGLLLDQGTKYGVFAWLYDGSPEGKRSVIPGMFQLVAHFTEDGQPYVNKGALFGLGQQHETRPHRFFTWLGQAVSDRAAALGLGRPRLDGATTANGFFAIVSLAAAGAIVAWSFRRSTARDRVLCAALGLILAGCVGNLYDRIVFAGVRDFLDFYLIRWPVFNVADCCLVCGAALLLAQAFWTSPASVPSPQTQAEVGASSKP